MRLTDIFPKIPTVRKLAVARPDVGEKREERDFWAWLRSLQGIVNTGTPALYLAPKGSAYNEDHWLTYYQDRFGISVEEIGGTEDVLDRYRGVAEGYILCDPDVLTDAEHRDHAQPAWRSCFQCCLSREHWMERAGIAKRDDLTGRFSNDWEAAEWAFENLWERCDKHLYANLCIHRPHWSSMSHHLEDYVVAHRILALDLSTSRLTRRSLNLYRRIMEAMESPGAQFGWHCTFDQEKEYVIEAAESAA